MKFVFTCCFCATGIRKTKIDPLSVCVTGQSDDDEHSQTFWAHVKCFAKALAKTIKGDLREELGGPALSIDWGKIKPVPEDKIPKFLRDLRKEHGGN